MDGLIRSVMFQDISCSRAVSGSSHKRLVVPRKIRWPMREPQSLSDIDLVSTTPGISMTEAKLCVELAGVQLMIGRFRGGRSKDLGVDAHEFQRDR